MKINQLNISAKLAISFYTSLVLIGAFSAVILLGLLLSDKEEGFAIPTIDKIKIKYGYPLIISSMKTSMYEYVSYDEEIDIVADWIAKGADKKAFNKDIKPIMKANCTNCHSKTSTMTKAVPHMPLSKYKDVKKYLKGGYNWVKMANQAHFHSFGIALIIMIISLLFAFTRYLPWIKNLLIIAAPSALMLDLIGWWITKYNFEFAYLIFIFGTVMTSSIITMSFLVLIDTWIKLPFITIKNKDE